MSQPAARAADIPGMSFGFRFHPAARPLPAVPALWPSATATLADATAGDDAQTDPGPVFRLRCWPPLPAQYRTSRVFRVLALMSQTPVSLQWLLCRSGLAPSQVDELILNLVVHRAVDVSLLSVSTQRH